MKIFGILPDPLSCKPYKVVLVLLINLSASPYHGGKGHSREQMLRTRAADNSAIVAFCNQIGGQDELVFDGGSVIVNERGTVVARGAQFAEDFVVADLDVGCCFPLAFA